MNRCDYCLVELEIGVNWNTTRASNNRYVCKKCASKIAQGKMSRKERKKFDSFETKSNIEISQILDPEVALRQSEELSYRKLSHSEIDRRNKIREILKIVIINTENDRTYTLKELKKFNEKISE